MYGLDGKVALITGAGRGIGRAIALRLAREGCDVALSDLNAETAEEGAAEARALGRRALAIASDVTKADQVDAMVRRTLAALGRVHAPVNIPGIQSASPTPYLSEQHLDIH